MDHHRLRSSWATTRVVEGRRRGWDRNRIWRGLYTAVWSSILQVGIVNRDFKGLSGRRSCSLGKSESHGVSDLRCPTLHNLKCSTSNDLMLRFYAVNSRVQLRRDYQTPSAIH